MDKGISPVQCVELQREATLFAFWKSIPAMVENEKYLNRIKGFEGDTETLEKVRGLFECRTLNDFAEYVGVSYTTVAKWNTKPEIQKKVEEFNYHNNAMRFKQDVDFAFTKATIKNADPQRFKLWKQYFEGWVPKEGNVHELDEDNMTSIQRKLKSLAEKKDNEDIINQDEEISRGNNEEAGSNERRLGAGQRDGQDALQG